MLPFTLCAPLAAADIEAAGADPAPIEAERSPQLARGRVLRTTGIAVTAHGVALAAFGGTMAAVVGGQTCPSEGGQCGLSQGLGVFAGGGIALSSIPFLAVGIPMLVVGHNKVRKAKRRQSVGELRLGPMGARPGLALSGRW